MESSEQATQNETSAFGTLVKKASRNVTEIRRLKVELKNLSREFAKLSQDLDPDTGSFASESTTSVFVKVDQVSPPKTREFSMPDHPGELIDNISNLEQETRNTIDAIKAIDPEFCLGHRY